MEARDTVMKRVQVNTLWKDIGIGSSIPEWAGYDENHPTYKLLKAQAEITWPIAEKAGYEEAIKNLSQDHKVIVALDESLRGERQEGRKEVVEWVEKEGLTEGQCNCMSITQGDIHIPSEDWQSFRKEWGL